MEADPLAAKRQAFVEKQALKMARGPQAPLAYVLLNSCS